MIVKMVRVIHAEIGDKALDDFVKANAAEDELSVDTVMESEFDDDGKVVTYIVRKQATTVERDDSGEFKPTITVEPINEELTVKQYKELSDDDEK